MSSPTSVPRAVGSQSYKAELVFQGLGTTGSEELRFSGYTVVVLPDEKFWRLAVVMPMKVLNAPELYT